MYTTLSAFTLENSEVELCISDFASGRVKAKPTNTSLDLTPLYTTFGRTQTYVYQPSGYQEDYLVCLKIKVPYRVPEVDSHGLT